MLEFYALAARDTNVRQFLQNYYLRYHQLLVDLLQQSFTGGKFQSGTAEAAAVSLIAQLEGLGLLWTIAPELVPLAEQAEAAVDLLLRGLIVADT